MQTQEIITQVCPHCRKPYEVKELRPNDPICSACQQLGWWKTGDGQVLHVSQMQDSHLTNLYNYLQRKADRTLSRATLSAYSMAGYLQGEMAQDSIWSEIDNLEQSDWVDVAIEYAIWRPLVEEIDKRGIE